MNATTTLTLLRQHSMPSLVQDELERMILDGRLEPGAPLREVALAATLGISRGPLREAFRGLEEKGLVTVIKNRGVFVRTLCADEADEIYEVRIVLEALIGRLLATNITVQGIDELRDILADMARAVAAVDIGCYTSLNLQFHDRLAALTGNAKLNEAYRRLVGELSLFRRQAYVHNRATLLLSLREHRAIVKAVAAHDGNRAEQLLKRHAEDSRRRMNEAMAATEAKPSRRNSSASSQG